jgi:secreted PhoX family phosphatase
MTKFTRRQLLAFFGASAGVTVLGPVFGEQLFGGNEAVVNATQPLGFTPVRLPFPLEIYTEQESYLPTGIGQGTVLQPSADAQLSNYTLIDDVVVPPEYERYVIVAWGDRVFPNPEDYFGYNSDYTAFVPINGRSTNDGYLWNNHEYVSFPISAVAPGTPNDLAASPTTFSSVIGQNLPQDRTNIEVLGEFMYNLGGSVLRIARQNPTERFEVIPDANNRRIHGLSGLGINSQRTDSYQNVTSWGQRGYQQGDNNYLIGTGPAATDVFPLSSDGLGNRIIGTGFNCSGGTTPWGTILSAEENFQGSSAFFVGVTEPVNSDGTQTGYTSGTTGSVFGLVGEKYGWMVELDPANQSFRPRKHTALGRFRHENIAFRVQPRQRLVAYMGDDRRGGHTWKFVSNGRVTSVRDKNNSRLFEEGTLYVARFNPDGTGEWIPLELNTPTNPIPPSVLGSVEINALGSASRNAATFLRRFSPAANETVFVSVNVNNEAQILPIYQGKTLSDFYTSKGAMLVDAFLAANIVGGTPTARPEDLEINPRNPREVFIAYTDGVAGGDGYPDSRIFVVSKYSADINEGQPSGALFKIIEDSDDNTGTTFRWERFSKGGEVGAEPGDGFANVDNLAFDSAGNIWGVTDMSTGSHNGFTDGADTQEITIDHTVTGSAAANLIGVFGNNFLFYIPTTGPDAGEVIPFAYGPVRCEMTGPTFVGNTLIIAVQHPGEDVPFSPQATLTRDIEILSLDGSSVFTQTRNVPRGSNWPSNIQGDPNGVPRPAVIGIRRLQSQGRFV